MLRTCVLCCAVAGLVGLVVGCDGRQESKLPAIHQNESITVYKVRLDELDKKVADLKARAEKATGDEKTKLEAKWKESAGKREAFAKKFDAVKAAAEDKLEAAKKEAEAALDEFRKAVE